MNKTFMLANAIGFIDDDLIIESEQPLAKKPLRLGYAAAAACLCVAGGAAVVVNNRSVPESAVSQGSLTIPESAVSPAQPAENSAPEPDVSVLAFPADEIIFNEVTEEISGARLYFDPEIYDEIEWGKEDILEYYGRELTPAYIPEGLIPSAWNEHPATVFVKKEDGQIVYDRVGLSFYHDYYEDGSPKLTDDIPAVKGVGIAVSKLRFPFECGIYSDLGDKKTTDINGTPVAFSVRYAPYGPYDPETHEPAGFYDQYIAEFETDGIFYRVVTDQLSANEIIQIVDSILA